MCEPDIGYLDFLQRGFKNKVGVVRVHEFFYIMSRVKINPLNLRGCGLNDFLKLFLKRFKVVPPLYLLPVVVYRTVLGRKRRSLFCLSNLLFSFYSFFFLTLIIDTLVNNLKL